MTDWQRYAATYGLLTAEIHSRVHTDKSVKCLIGPERYGVLYPGLMPLEERY